jgi:hypothetical protein
MANDDEVDECWNMLISAFPMNKVATGTAKVYALTLADLPGDILRAAVLDCIYRLRFFPTVAEIREAAGRIAIPDIQPALEAWGDVARALNENDKRLHFDNPLTERCVSSMGWGYLGRSQELVADRARFIEMYNQLAERQRCDSLSSPEALEVRRRLALLQPAEQTRSARAASREAGDGRHEIDILEAL